MKGASSKIQKFDRSKNYGRNTKQEKYYKLRQLRKVQGSSKNPDSFTATA